MDRVRRRKFGQNFLDVETATAIAGDLPAEAGEYVLEIGPGHGALTEHLLNRGLELTAVEIDARRRCNVRRCMRASGFLRRA